MVDIAQKKSIVAAMKYLQKVKPDRYSLVEYACPTYMEYDFIDYEVKKVIQKIIIFKGEWISVNNDKRD